MPEIPKQLLDSLSGLDGFDEKAFVDAHHHEQRITSIRINPFKKLLPGQLDFELGDKVQWAEQAFYLPERPSFTFDPLFHAGCYYVQEAGSMFIEFALKQTVDFSQTLNVLDLCGAPGGKSTLIASLLNEKSLLVANEFVKNRADILTQNISRWGTHNTIVTNNDPQKFSELSGFFDVLVVDAPCSGSGLFRKQPEAIAEWSENNVNQCSIRQQKILENALPSLKENGICVYSTCSYSVKENEDIVKWMVETHQMEYVSLALPANWGIVETGMGYRFYPHLTKSEGFFCAVLRKKTRPEQVYISKKKIVIEATKAERIVLTPFIVPMAIGSDFKIIKKNNQFHLVNQSGSDFLTAFEKQFYFKKAGCVLGEIKGEDMIPNQELAWSTQVGKTVHRVDLDLENALKFLKKENISVEDAKKGLALITYKHFGIGWAKMLPNRVNNYLPNELRILARQP